MLVGMQKAYVQEYHHGRNYTWGEKKENKLILEIRKPFFFF